VKKDLSEPALYGAVLAVLLAIRIGSFLSKRWTSARVTAASP